MKISLTKTPKKGTPLAFFMFEGDDLAKHPLLAFLIKNEKEYLLGIKKEITPKEFEVKILLLPGGRPVFFVGIGKTSEFVPLKPALGMRALVQAARKEHIGTFAIWVGLMKTSQETQNFYEVLFSNTIMADFEFVQYKTAPQGGFASIKEIEAVSNAIDPDVKEGLRRGIIIGEETNECRRLSNTPGGDMTPDVLAVHAKKAGTKAGVKVSVLDEKKMKSLGMGGVLGVAKGSDVPAHFIIMEYMKGPKGEKPVVLAGKGVTFDTGGLNIKPGDSIYEMHMDMSGGAAVIHTIIAAARLKLKKNIVALIPAVENMPSGRSYRPGDLLRTMNGKTIEVLNTDAEGRVILSDTLEYAKKYNPSLVIDVATLTGAAIVALGHRYSGLFTSDKKLQEKFCAIGEMVGDPVWPLPLSAGFEDDVRGTFGDWANTGKKGQGGGASTGAAFLWQFVKDAKTGKEAYPWVHLDIAPRMTSIDSEFLAKGAAGAPVRLLVRLLEES